MANNVTIVRAGQLVAAYDEDTILNGAVAVTGDKITAVGNFEKLAADFPDADSIGGDDFLLIPGLINGHGNGRGLSDFQRGALDNTLESWLFDTRKYVPVSVYDDLAMSAIRLLKSGVTTTMHNHLLKDPVAFEAEFEEGLQAYKDSGMRVQFNPAVTHYPSCNLRVRNGISPAFHMLQAGVLVGLGLDGKSINDDDDMIQEMKDCYLLHRLLIRRRRGNR